MGMTGGTIDIEGGTLRNGGWQDANWTTNLASMNIAAGGSSTSGRARRRISTP